MPGYSARHFVDGDETGLAGLGQRVDQEYLRPIPKTPSEWKRRLVQRPGVRPEGVIVVERDDGEVVGYAAVGCSGKVYDLCVSPGDEEGAFTTLLQRVERYAREQSAGQMTVAVPPGRTVLLARLKRSGYTPWLKYVMGLPLDFPRLIELVAGENLSLHKRRVRGALSIRLEKGERRFRTPAFAEELFLRVDNDGLQAGLGPIAADVTIRTDVSTFTNLILRQAGVTRAILAREVRVFPLRRVPLAVGLLSLVVMPHAWYMSVGDAV